MIYPEIRAAEALARADRIPEPVPPAVRTYRAGAARRALRVRSGDRQIRFDREWESRVVSMILRNLSSLFERSLTNLAELNRYRKELAARLARMEQAA